MRTVAPTTLVAAEALVGRMEAGGWQQRLRMSLRNGGYVTQYVWAHDQRVTLEVWRRSSRAKAVETYIFADGGVIEVEELVPPLIGDRGADFGSMLDLAVAMVEHDDARAWYRAAPDFDAWMEKVIHG